jgi:PadR family transcriptional regulator, regulatory protein PadR
MDSHFPGSAVEMLILEVIAHGPTYGYQITQTVAERSQGYFELKEGSLYPALHRMERQKLLRASWSEADGRRRKYYELTDAGRADLAARKQSWQSFAAGVSGVLGISRAALGFSASAD